jgi:hypothetical protein
MAALTWDALGTHLYETGVDKGVLYVPGVSGAYDTGFAWNGLVSVTESPTGAEATPQYADNIKYLNMISAETFAATLEAFTYPEEFNQFDGMVSGAGGVWVAQQPRKTFGLCYRTKHGNEVDGDSHGYKLHLLYGCIASPSEKAYNTINDSPEAITFSWSISTTPTAVTGKSPTSLLIIDSLVANAAKLTTLEGILYGASAAPLLPTPNSVITTMT